MLAKKYRLKKRKDFENVLKKGKGVKGGPLFLKIIKKENSEEKKFGFIISKKISKKATVRNKIKRRLHEIIREKLGKIEKGINVVLIALPSIERESFENLKNIVERLFKKAKIL